MNSKRLSALALADMMLATDASAAALLAACTHAFDAAPPWLPKICLALSERTGDNFHFFSRHEIAEILLQLLDSGPGPGGDAIALPPIRRYCTAPPIQPPKAEWLARLALPELPTVGALAAWLEEPVSALAWLADQWRDGGEASAPHAPLQHYHYRWIPKRSGGIRLIEIPKSRLRRIQQKILRRILDLVPPHPAAHGFQRGRSSVTHAALHTGQDIVIRIDLKDFFPSIQYARIHALFEKLGYPATVSATLARLCTNRTPRATMLGKHAGAAPDWPERQALKSPHLPQGSPCSPALANLCAYRLDIRLASLAQALGASYSRYADDLVFSGGPDFARAAERLHIQAAAIALEEGFRVNTRKTRIMRKGTRQQVTGIVVNTHSNIARDDYEALKATLTNCQRHGPASQNRGQHADFRAHLAGKVAYIRMVNPNRALKLQRLLDGVTWDAPPA